MQLGERKRQEVESILVQPGRSSILSPSNNLEGDSMNEMFSSLSVDDTMRASTNRVSTEGLFANGLPLQNSNSSRSNSNSSSVSPHHADIQDVVLKKQQLKESQWVDDEGNKKLGKDIIVVTGLTKEFHLDGEAETVKALNGIDMAKGTAIFPVREGEFVMIRGPSGGGKTTLLNMIGSIDEPSSGTVELFGDLIDKNSDDEYLADLRLRRVGFVFQTFNLIATMSAFENVELPMSILGKRTTVEARKHALYLLDMVGLQDRYSHLPSELSGGEQQRVAIARALSNDPQVLLLDEPTGDLDTRNTIDVMDILLNINRTKGTTCLMVTHNPDLECYADRILYVEDGIFAKQAINKVQLKLDYEAYMDHINEEQKKHVKKGST